MSFNNYSISDHLDHLAEGNMASFHQGELLKVLLAHSASNLPSTMLEQLSARKLGTKELEEQITEELEKHNDELEEGHSEFEEQNTKLETKEIDMKTTELTKQVQELEEKTADLENRIKELEEQQADLKTQHKELTAHSKELEEPTKELEGKHKELEKQQAGLDIALVKAVLSQLAEEEKELDFNMMIGEEACKSFTQIASTQLPQQDVKGAWLEQLASEQQLIIGSLNIGFANFLVKCAAFKKKKELSQNSFLESKLSENNLQTSLAKSMQWPSLSSKSFPRMKEHQLHQQEPGFGHQAPRASIGACKRACKKAAYPTAHRRSRRSSLTKNFCRKSSGALAYKDLLAEWTAAFIACNVEQLQASSFTESSLSLAACQPSSLTAIASSSLLLGSSFEQL